MMRWRHGLRRRRLPSALSDQVGGWLRPLPARPYVSVTRTRTSPWSGIDPAPFAATDGRRDRDDGPRNGPLAHFPGPAAVPRELLRRRTAVRAVWLRRA